MKFVDYGFDDSILKAIEEKGFETPTEVQEKSFDPVLDGYDVVVQAKTGSGKTAAFGLPLVQILKDEEPGLRALILLPTRELAKQVHEDLEFYAKYTKLRFAIVYGGVGMEPQIDAISKADVVIGTPGRILDHMRQGTLDLGGIQFLVLDEADRMLDMGFIDDVRAIIKQIPQDHITMLFSATMPTAIREIAERMMFEPQHIKCESFVDDTLLTQYYVNVANRHKLHTLREIIRREKPELSIVFCATRGLTDAVAAYLQSEDIEAQAIHGGLTQAKREQVLSKFHQGKVHVMVATDVAARGLDISDVTHVFNYNVPNSPQEYTHRMGRTARAGKSGKVVTLLGQDEHDDFRNIDAFFTGKIEKYDLEGFRPMSVNMPRRNYDDGDHLPQRGGGRGPRRDGPRGNGGPRGPRRDGPRPENRGPRSDAPRGPRPEGQRQGRRRGGRGGPRTDAAPRPAEEPRVAEEHKSFYGTKN